MDMTVVPTCTLTAMEMTSHHQGSEYTVHAEVTDMDTHAEDLTTTVTATLTSETTDTHQAPQVVMDSTCTTTITVMIAVTTVEYMDIWIVIATDMDTHATEITTDMTVVPTCMLTAMEMTSHHQASEYTAHAEDMDMDTHAEDLITTVTAMPTSETMDTHQAPQVVMDSTCTTTITVVIAVTTVEYTDTWIVIATDMDTHATEITTDMTVVLTCMLIAMEMTSHHQASEYTAHAEGTDMDTHAEDLITTVTAMLTSETTDTHQAPQVVMDSTCTTTITVVIVVTTVEYTDIWIV